MKAHSMLCTGGILLSVSVHVCGGDAVSSRVSWARWSHADRSRRASVPPALWPASLRRRAFPTATGSLHLDDAGRCERSQRWRVECRQSSLELQTDTWTVNNCRGFTHCPNQILNIRCFTSSLVSVCSSVHNSSSVIMTRAEPKKSVNNEAKTCLLILFRVPKHTGVFF